MNQGRTMEQLWQTAVIGSQALMASLLWMAIGASQPAFSANIPPVTAHLSAQSELQPSLEPLDLTQCSPSTSGITDSSISQAHLTVPSFWWTRDQISAQPQFGGKLLDTWLACPHQKSSVSRVDFVVNQQAWSLLDYLERYDFVQQIGTVASGYSYDMRVFNRQGGLLAAYTCDFEGNIVGTRELNDRHGVKVASADLSQTSPSPTPSALICNLSLDSSGKAGFRGRSNSLDGTVPKGNGTIQP